MMLKLSPSAAARHWPARRAFSAVYICQFFFLGMQLPFLPAWLDERGYAEAEIGGLFGAALILRLALGPLIAYWVEGRVPERLPIIAAAGAMAASCLLLLLPLPLWLGAVFIILMLFCFGLLVPLIDAAVLRADRAGLLAYGTARGAGSSSFIVATLLGGYAIGQTTSETVMVWMTVSALSLVVATLAMPMAHKERTPKAPSARPSLARAAALFRSPSFLLMLAACGLVQGAHATYYGFAELHWSALGYSSFLIGVLWSLGVIVEIILLLKVRSLVARLSPSWLIALGAVGALVRWPLTGLSPPLFVLVFLQCLHALTFAATYIGSIEFIDRACPPEYRATALTLVSTVGVGAVTGVASVMVGFVFDREAPVLAYGLMGAMGGLGLLAALALARRWKGGLLQAI